MDTRDFDYPLEPLRRQRAYQLEAAARQLAASRQRLDRAQAELMRLREQAERLAGEAALRPGQSIDPHWLGLRLAHLQRAQEAVERAEQDRDDAQDEANRHRQAHAKAHARKEAVEQHREKALAVHGRTQLRRQASEADRDWLARKAGGHGAVHPTAPTDHTEVLHAER